jgi:D-alanine-D-alanine ligase
MHLGGQMIGVIYGGDSFEHEVSVESAFDIAKALHATKIYLTKDGRWQVDGEAVDNIIPVLKACDMIFPIIHGGFGEDGTLQGFLEMNGIPYVGSGVLASAICMDKDFTKRILESHGIATTPFRTFYSLQEALNAEVSMPCIIKAASLGSSIGVYKVLKDPQDAFEKAFSLCDKVLVEEVIEGRELWCSVLQDGEELIASQPCEIVPKDEFFTYENKYLEVDGALYHVPAKDVDSDLIRAISKKVFLLLGCKGMARVDLFVRRNGEILVNEVNTLPGFRKKSLFPKALIQDGIAYEEILQKLIVKTSLLLSK